jgi:hypothetical protein
VVSYLRPGKARALAFCLLELAERRTEPGMSRVSLSATLRLLLDAS